MQEEGSISLVKQDHFSWHDTKVRWLALFLACLIQMGNYFCYDFPAVLEETIEDYFDVSSFQYNLLYSVYSFPNIVLPLFGGILFDYIGIRKGIVFYSVPLMIGQGLCILGAIQKNFTWLIVGRVIYGLGGENGSVIQSTIVSKWFEGKEIAFALGLNITLSRLGSILNSVLTPRIADATNVTTSLIFGFGTLILSEFACIALALLDKKSDQRDKAQEKSMEMPTEKIQCSDIKAFKIYFWAVVLSCMLSYTNLFVLQQNDVKMFKKLFGMSENSAQTMYQIPYYMGAILTPFIGITIDKIGQRPYFLIVSGVMIMLVNVWYLILPTCTDCFVQPAIGQVALGVFYSLYAAVMWPCVPLCVPPQTLGTAYGITNSVQNFGLFAGPLAVGLIIKSESVSSYRYMMVFFLGIGSVALLNNIFLKLYDHFKLEGKLSSKSGQDQNKTKVGPINTVDYISEPSQSQSYF